MRRAISVVLATMVLAPVSVAAQDAWPTGDEIRLSLQDIGYEFGFGTVFGGDSGEAPRWLGDRPQDFFVYPLIRINAQSDILVLWVSTIETYEMAYTYDQAVGSQATTLMEILARIPGDDVPIAERILAGGKGCDVFEIPGGSVTVDGTDWTKKAPSYDVLIVEGVPDGLCADT
jgi:hypothetical protein